MPRHHDMGGTPAGPIEIAEHDAEPWHKLVTALFGALRGRKLMEIDELRRALEDLPPEEYDRGYFERWSEAACNLLEEKSILTRAEVEARMSEIRKRLEAGR